MSEKLEKAYDYYEAFDFLTSDENSNDNKNIAETISKTQPSNFKKSLMTVDKLNTNEINLEKAAQVILTEESLPADPSLFTKSNASQILESPEFNKKLRAQNEYKQMTAKTIAEKKSSSLNKDMNEIIGNKNFEINKFKQVEETKPETPNVEFVENEVKHKIYKIKKNKPNNEKVLVKEELPINSNGKYFTKVLTFGFGISLLGLYLYKFRKNMLNKFNYK
jgi:hypothetical protein